MRPPLLAELVARHGGALHPSSAGSRPVAGLCAIDKPRPEHLGVALAAKQRARCARFDGVAVVVDVLEPELATPQWLHPRPLALWRCLADELHPLPVACLQAREAAWVDATARVHSTARLGPGVVLGAEVEVGARVCLGAHAIVEACCRLDDDVVLESGVVLGPRCVLEARVGVGAGSVIGRPGFGFAHEAGAWARLPHLGGVHIGADCQIAALCTIDAGTFEPTRIGARTRIDSHVHIAHNADIGADCVLLAQVGLAGSVSLGDGCVLAGQVGVANGLRLGARTQVAAQGGVGRNTVPGMRLGGSPAIELELWRRAQTLLRLLAEAPPADGRSALDPDASGDT